MDQQDISRDGENVLILHDVLTDWLNLFPWDLLNWNLVYADHRWGNLRRVALGYPKGLFYMALKLWMNRRFDNRPICISHLPDEPVLTGYMGKNLIMKAKVGISSPGDCLTMSSGPSQECRKGTSSGTSLLSIISMSSRTSGSQFSLMARLAEVCSSWMCISPTENWESSGSWKKGQVLVPGILSIKLWPYKLYSSDRSTVPSLFNWHPLNLEWLRDNFFQAHYR